MKQINKKAFTLVELLVVVLIIGILAAIAVPQYQVAVIKSRVATILPIMKNLVDAEEVYYLANDKYTQLFRNLDVSITPVCTKAEYEQHQTCGNDFLLVLSDGLLHAVYCPGANTSIKECNKKAEFAIYGFFQNSSNMQYKGSWRCAKQNNSDFGVKICKALPFLGNNY